MTCTEGAHKGVVTCNCTWQGLLEDLRKAREECAELERKLEIARAAIRGGSEHGGAFWREEALAAIDGKGEGG